MKRILLTFAALITTIAISHAADLGDYHWRGASHHGGYLTVFAPHPRIVRPHYSYRAHVGMTGPAGWYSPGPRIVEEWVPPEPTYPVLVYPQPYVQIAHPCGYY